ncbi:histidine ammonia-lyase [Rhodoplanes sp. TEM]|uniref:Histidine ammonia-lyase n=1 Tax=Rhodoplanes tepidamans TaxID=200616 RepID=A0ABT5J3Z3_RHOTP|nr:MULTISPECIES: histidine ammonia-lyase [Rhodoplanes]MDC7784359.1 histidine ammonia-lyase [Rhodoplanes tepidamans]MDC7983377.1 histidine ammonia-lyase [Rhodoplanes sp. TEM]MDQ0354513.1 histidine ammonia-lyase [Rhodoplanes tepidamans]
MTTVCLDGETLSIADVVRIAREGASVEISAAARAEIVKVRDYIDTHWLTDNAPATYGFNTGVGKLKDFVISQADNDRFQLSIVMSHCGGMGDPAPEDWVRAMMAIRINAFCLGVSGLRIEVVGRLITMLNRGVHPVVPLQGSVGASGDLAPLAHMVSVMIGYEKAEAFYQGVRMPAPAALEKAGIAPVRFDLKAKDCLALINGNSLCAAMAALNLHDGERLMKQADVTGALSVEAIRGEQAAFDARIHAARRQPGQITVAGNVRRIMAGTRRSTEGARAVRLPHDVLHPTHTARVQDQYSFRCLPQVHGACRDNLAYAKTLIERELNAATDNPLVFWDERGALEFLSGGNFHCEPIAFAMDILAMSLAEIGNISERRLFALCDPTLSYGLPANLAGEPIGLNSGYSIISCSAASVASENKTLCFPASVDTIPTKSNQEDHVSMAAWACRKARQIIDNLPKIVGIEALLAARAIFVTEEQLGGYALGAGSTAAYKALRAAIPFQMDDLYMPLQSGPAVDLARKGALLDAAEAAIGALD